jgi:hypothetical protein
MRHRVKGRQLSRTASHKRALLRNMATSLFQHDRVTTTEAKAKELRPYAERLITLARRGDLATYMPGASLNVASGTGKHWIGSSRRLDLGSRRVQVAIPVF